MSEDSLPTPSTVCMSLFNVIEKNAGKRFSKHELMHLMQADLDDKGESITLTSDRFHRAARELRLFCGASEKPIMLVTEKMAGGKAEWFITDDVLAMKRYQIKLLSLATSHAQTATAVAQTVASRMLDLGMDAAHAEAMVRQGNFYISELENLKDTVKKQLAATTAA